MELMPLKQMELDILVPVMYLALYRWSESIKTLSKGSKQCVMLECN